MILLVSLAVIAAIVFLSGPRVRIDQTILPKDFPVDLDDYLFFQEQQFSDIIPGTQKTVIWAGTPNEQTEFSVVYIHGFSATRQETAPLSDIVAQTLEANLFYTRLTGHGRTGQAMAGADVNDWLNDVVDAYEIGRRIGSKVIMIGCSTGATSLAWLAHRAATVGGMEALYACIFLSPNFRPQNSFSFILTWPWGLQIARIVIGKEREMTPENKGHEQYWINRYPVEALLPMMGMVKLVRGLNLSKIRVPGLVIFSPQDQIIQIPSLEQAFKKMGCVRKQLVPFTGSSDPGQHILAGDIFSPGTSKELAEMIVAFVRIQDA
ncbi:alpha/beta fold hydrolase [uncultured Desulfobacter sp.]|uniref:alpha/beta hydrolase n=1 Tax=uncultured Desulfobacter sp. TaxID=240139 RepID=UPI0029F4C084|nr:alpha/beta fold hydrolase [uncultured Desulfobacter sp.]